MRALFLLLAVLTATGCFLPLSGQGGEGGAQVTTSPSVISTAPKDAATEVALGTRIKVVFSEAMDPSTLTGATFTVTHGGAAVAGAVTYSGVTATFTPTIALALGARYTATITTGVEDPAHDALAADHTWSFTTRAVADTTLPTVTSTSPTNVAQDVAADVELRATFSEAMDPLTVTGATFTLMDGGAAVPGAVTYAGTTAVFKPESALPLDGSFLATVSTGVTDLAGNSPATKFTWTFTTFRRPKVASTSPADGAQGTTLNRPVVATFSAKMDPATITAATFFVKDGAAPVSGTVTYLDTTVTFVPTSNYAPNATLTATITTGARDLSGNTLAKNHVWSFMTGTKTSQAPVALGLASPFAVLAYDMIANTASPGTLVTGDLGISPGASLAGFPPGMITGDKHVGDAVASLAQVAFLVAYNDAVARPNPAPLPADLTGQKLTPGLYRHASAVALSAGSCTLDAEGDANAVFIFQIGTGLSLAASTQILLSGGAKATNILWAVGASATLGAKAKLKGTILATTAITLGAGATVEGRLLAHGASVTLDTNTITVPAP